MNKKGVATTGNGRSKGSASPWRRPATSLPHAWTMLLAVLGAALTAAAGFVLLP